MFAAGTMLAANVKLIATNLQPSNACARILDFIQQCHTCHVMFHRHEQAFCSTCT